MQLRVIRNADQHEAALREIGRLIRAAPSEGTDDAEQLAVLALLVEDYEQERFPIGLPTPVEAIRFRMEQAGLTEQDLEPYIGSPSEVSELLSGKTPLTPRMIRALHTNLGIPAAVLIACPEPAADEDS